MAPSQVDELLQSCLGACDADHVEEDVLVCDASDVDANAFGIIGGRASAFVSFFFGWTLVHMA